MPSQFLTAVLCVHSVRQEHIDTICLPEANSQPVYGQDCFATGWGKDSFEQGQFQLVLKQVALPLVNHATCQVGPAPGCHYLHSTL